MAAAIAADSGRGGAGGPVGPCAAGARGAATETAVAADIRGVPQLEQNFPLAGLPHSEQYMAPHVLVVCRNSAGRANLSRNLRVRWARSLANRRMQERSVPGCPSDFR